MQVRALAKIHLPATPARLDKYQLEEADEVEAEVSIIGHVEMDKGYEDRHGLRVEADRFEIEINEVVELFPDGVAVDLEPDEIKSIEDALEEALVLAWVNG